VTFKYSIIGVVAFAEFGGQASSVIVMDHAGKIGLLESVIN
jgi:hypothetical protein